ncbi:permease [Paenibacillus thermotolerans]|uniref:permease n=1 Tax=Paenibacillus thermotolerans TaxID=3027807 RepID=UPI002367BD75|nr:MULTISPECIES: permease [unclassified Paenibacillus]
MNQELASSKPLGTVRPNKKSVISIAIFLIILIAGLAYVKWVPYFHKAFTAADTHSIGASIVSGTAATAPAPSWEAAWSYAAAYYKSVWKAAVLGILLGSLVQVLIPKQWLMRVLGKATFGSTAIAGAASIPGMMCTCCAAPIAVGLRKRNVSVGAALAFWLGNPAINPATLIFMMFVLGWKFTALRLIFGLLLVFGVSYLANRLASDAAIPEEIEKSQSGGAEEDRPIWRRWLSSVWKLTLAIVPAYIIAVLLLGAFRAWLLPAVGETASYGILTIIALSIAGMLFVIPTAAEIPIVQTMMSFGMGAGPAAALLITLPSVSLPSLLMIKKAFPARVLVFVASSVVILGVLCGIVGSWVL